MAHCGRNGEAHPEAETEQEVLEGFLHGIHSSTWGPSSDFLKSSRLLPRSPESISFFRISISWIESGDGRYPLVLISHSPMSPTANPATTQKNLLTLNGFCPAIRRQEIEVRRHE